VTVPLSEIRPTASGFTLRRAGGTDTLTRLTFVARTHRLHVTTRALTDTGLEAGTDLETTVPVHVTIPTADGVARFESDVLLRRASLRTRAWRR
jgi:hypothetical protein